MRNLSIVMLSGLILICLVSARREATEIRVNTVESYETDAYFASKAGCVTTLVRVALNHQEETIEPSVTSTLQETGLISVTQFSDPKNGQDPTTGKACPALPLQEMSATLQPSSTVSLKIDPDLATAQFKGQALLADPQGGQQFVVFQVLWKANGLVKPEWRDDTQIEGLTTVRRVYKARTRRAIAFGLITACDQDQDGACSAEELNTATNYINIPAQGEKTFIRWSKIRSVSQTVKD